MNWENIKPVLLKGIPYVAVLVIGVGVGWTLKPAAVRVEEKVKIVEVEKQVVVEVERVRVEVVKVKDTTVVERWHREKTEERKPDGTVTTKEIEDRNIDERVVERENKVEVKVVEVTKEVVVYKDKVVEKKQDVSLPNWHLGISGALGPDLDPIALHGEFSATVERRVLGPFFMGATIGVGTDFKAVKGVHGGISLGLEF